MKVLVVDDEEDIAEATRVLLETAGHLVQVVTVADAEVEELERFRPDVVLQDLNMPDLDIDQMVAAIRRVLPGLPVVLFTAAGNGDEVQDRLGAEGLVRKPFRLHELLHVLEAVTTRRTAFVL